jgi:hypothetical protein
LSLLHVDRAYPGSAGIHDLGQLAVPRATVIGSSLSVWDSPCSRRNRFVGGATPEAVPTAVTAVPDVTLKNRLPTPSARSQSSVISSRSCARRWSRSSN